VGAKSQLSRWVSGEKVGEKVGEKAGGKSLGKSGGKAGKSAKPWKGRKSGATAAVAPLPAPRFLAHLQLPLFLFPDHFVVYATRQTEGIKGILNPLHLPAKLQLSMLAFTFDGRPLEKILQMDQVFYALSYHIKKILFAQHSSQFQTYM